MGPHAPARAGRHGRLVVEPAAESLAPGSRRAAPGQHLHDLAHPARGRPELAEEPHLVRNRRGDAQAHARRGARPRSRYDGQKKLIEQAYTLGAQLGLSVWCEDEAGPFQAVPHPGTSWQPRGRPATQPHEYIRGGTTKILTLFHPATGQVRLQPAARGTNAVLHPWLRERLSEILAAQPVSKASLAPAVTRAAWAVWQAGLTMPFTLARRPAAAAAVAGVGQSCRPQDAGAGAVAVRTWRHAALHACGRQLAEHGGGDRARAQAPRARRAASTQPRGDRRLVGGEGAKRERPAAPLCGKRQTPPAAATI